MSLRRLWDDCSAVLFDFDGVLADSEPLYRETWNRVIHPAGPIPEEEYFRRWSFLGEGEQHLSEMGFDPDERAALRQSQKRIYGSLCAGGSVPLFPETAPLLEWVSFRKPFIIASNTESELVSAVLRHGGVAEAPVVGGEGLRHKPHPDIFLAAAGLLGFPPGRCLVVEDAWKGIEAAGRGGFPSLLVRNRNNRGLEAKASFEASGLSGILEAWRGGENP